MPLGGRMVTIERPRARIVDRGEARLESWELLSQVDLLNERVMAAMLAGVSTRDYATVALEPLGAEIESVEVSKSAVSRRFIAATQARLNEFRARPLGVESFLVVYIDGFGLGEELLVGALGVTGDGRKVCLGVVQGTTENKTVVAKLLNDLEDRGFDGSGCLFVTDGGKALREVAPLFVEFRVAGFGVHCRGGV